MINELIDISIDAGKKILEIYNSDDFGVEYKNDESPLTKADLASHDVIIKGLEKLNEKMGYNFPVLSEESQEIEFDERSSWVKYWLIDPLDGTKEFVKRNGEFTVNIALIVNGVPSIGFVYVPVQDILYYGYEDGAYKITNASKTCNEKIQLRTYDKTKSTIKIVASKSHLNDETKNIIDKIQKKYEGSEFYSYGSSLKLCKIADGSADFYPRIAPTMEWDTAAADAVCRAAGCGVYSVDDNMSLRYNKEKLLNPYFYVTSIKEIKNIMESI